MKVAIIHYWLVAMRGGEKVLEELCEMYPEADIYTHVYDPDAVSANIKRHKILTSFIDKLPWAKHLYGSYLPLMPFALKKLDLSGYDLVISSESGPAKGVVVPTGCMHVCYCHTPMRYLWDMYEVYYRSSGMWTRFFMRLLVPWLRRWDKATASAVDIFVANSHFVSRRIERIYGRESVVIYPPVDIDAFSIASDIEDYYLYVGELTEYKQPELAVDAFNLSGRNLIVIGRGDMERRLRNKAKSNIQFIGHQPFSKLCNYMARCKALIFPGIEDFGIVPVEAMASGRPVIAFHEGGAAETVVSGKSGVFFHQQTVESLNAAVDSFEEDAGKFEPELIRRLASKYSKQAFTESFSRLLVED